VTLLVVLALATYRVTRFLILDDLIERPRIWVYMRLSRWPKVLELAGCPWCLSVWIAGALTAVAAVASSVPLPVLSWLAVAGGAMIPWRYMEFDNERSADE